MSPPGRDVMPSGYNSSTARAESVPAGCRMRFMQPVVMDEKTRRHVPVLASTTLIRWLQMSVTHKTPCSSATTARGREKSSRPLPPRGDPPMCRMKAPEEVMSFTRWLSWSHTAKATAGLTGSSAPVRSQRAPSLGSTKQSRSDKLVMPHGPLNSSSPAPRVPAPMTFTQRPVRQLTSFTRWFIWSQTARMSACPGTSDVPEGQLKSLSPSPGTPRRPSSRTTRPVV
mmetsp:Transcript_3548/g.11051  ORF Transcript_3548/g.11051 Transcript_3548/m.11051 type:complete len:227 (-) Transcript_3548:1083-1763(-)